MTKAARIYTDGACLGNPGPGGWAWISEDGDEDCGCEQLTTNQRMELKAALQGLLSHDGDLVVVSDSKYLVSCFDEKWYERWLSNNWKNAAGKPVSNRDLWEPILEIFLSGSRKIKFLWVKGHDGNPYNEKADLLARNCAISLIKS